MSDAAATPEPTGEAPTAAAWHPTACILCECNCGIEIRLGGDTGTRFERIRGDKAHPGSQGYTCEKALRLGHYQHQARLTSPMRRRDDGTYEAIDWDTAIREIAERFLAVRAAHGGETIFSYGGGGQGNHLGGGYGGATSRALGSVFKANALSQGLVDPAPPHEPLLHQHRDHRREAVRVGAGAHPEVDVGKLGRLAALRVDHDHRPIGIAGDLLRRGPGVGEAVTLPRVLADEHHHLGVCDVAAHGAAEHRQGGRAAGGAERVSPVTGSKIISGLVAALDLLVVIDVAMTETARLAHYVLPAPTQFEKWEATFFNFEFPNNVFHLRKPVLPAPEGALPEPEIHARLCEALGAISDADLAPLRAAAERSRADFAAAFFEATAANPVLGALAPVVLYRTLGPTLPDGAASAALLWGAAHRTAMNVGASVRRAGFDGEGFELGEALFDAILAGHRGVVFTHDDGDDVWARVRTDDGRIHLMIPELVDEFRSLVDEESITSVEFPFVLSAGERRSFTANTIIRDGGWRKRDAEGALRVSPADAAALGLVTGGQVRVITSRGEAQVSVEVYEGMQPGHVSLPNGLGLDEEHDGEVRRVGVPPNELTDARLRDPIAGTPWHKSVPARLEAVG